jgi:hypothetical protein
MKSDFPDSSYYKDLPESEGWGFGVFKFPSSPMSFPDGLGGTSSVPYIWFTGYFANGGMTGAGSRNWRLTSLQDFQKAVIASSNPGVQFRYYHKTVTDVGGRKEHMYGVDEVIAVDLTNFDEGWYAVYLGTDDDGSEIRVFTERTDDENLVPTLPTGFTKYRRIGWAYAELQADGTPKFRPFRKENAQATYLLPNESRVTNPGSATGYTGDVDISDWTPPGCTQVVLKNRAHTYSNNTNDYNWEIRPSTLVDYRVWAITHGQFLAADNTANGGETSRTHTPQDDYQEVVFNLPLIPLFGITGDVERHIYYKWDFSGAAAKDLYHEVLGYIDDD